MPSMPRLSHHTPFHIDAGASAPAHGIAQPRGQWGRGRRGREQISLSGFSASCKPALNWSQLITPMPDQEGPKVGLGAVGATVLNSATHDLDIAHFKTRHGRHIPAARE